MSLKEDIAILKTMVHQDERRFRFPYGEYGDEAELVIDVPPEWNRKAKPTATMIAIKGAWNAATQHPDSTLGKEMLRAAEKATGLKLAYSRLWKHDKNGNSVRPVVLVGGDTSSLHNTIPAFPRA